MSGSTFCTCKMGHGYRLSDPECPVHHDYSMDSLRTELATAQATILERERRLREAEGLLALYHPPHAYPEHHMCPGCTFLGRTPTTPSPGRACEVRDVRGKRVG